HAEDAEAGGFERSVQGGGQRQGEHAPGVGGPYDAVVPKSGRGVIRVAFALVLIAYRRFEGLFFVGAPAISPAFDAVAAYRSQNAGRLFAAHDGNAGVRPHREHARAEGPTAHAVVTRAERTADDHGELWHGGGGNGGNHLRTMPGNALVLVFAPHHEARDVLQEDERNASLAAQLDEVSTFLRGFREQDAVVGDDADRHAVNMGKPSDQCGAEARLELVEFRAVNNAGNHFAYVIRFAGVERNHTVEFGRVVQRFH